jgi:MoaA/NifB/PqqE/SkfB family radical SAM enzyme
MSLLVLFRTRLEWCNYTCGYCPWNASVRHVRAEEFRADEARLGRIVGRVAELPDAVEFFITPKAEYLVLPYWREAVGRLLALPQVERVTVQTNLSFDVAAFLDRVDAGKLALWTTYHPTEVAEEELDRLHAKWELLRQRGVPFSVGIVGTHENLPHMHRLRRRLDPGVYLWVNAYQREPDYYTAEQLAEVRSVDPYFDLNNQRYPSRGRPCTAGQRAVYLDDEGDLRRCFFVGAVLGNLYKDGWRRLDAPHGCPRETCHCYVGHMHVVELDFRSVYGKDLAARIPREWSSWEDRGVGFSTRDDVHRGPGFDFVLPEDGLEALTARRIR